MYKVIWKVKKQDEEKARDLAKKLSILPITASLLLNRNIENEEEGKKFLSPTLHDLHDPFLLEGMEQAVLRLGRAIKNREPIFLQGDYDVDGICATALLAKQLTELGGIVFCHLPDRHKEGHGISSYAVKKAIELKVGVFLTVDCGSSSHHQVESLNDYGIDVIITDHHEMRQNPPSLATINPRASSSYPYKDLAGVGVAFKVAQALGRFFNDNEKSLYDKLDLVALGTIADLSSLLGENRVLVKFGLEKLAKEPSKGLATLKKVIGLNGYIDSHKASFILAPRLNAPGRMKTPWKALELLVANKEEKRIEICQELETLNRERRSLESEILREIQSELEKLDLERDYIIVIKGKNWHRGLLGLVASKLVEMYQRPAFVLSQHEDVIKGSGRSIPSFNLYKALEEVSNLLSNFGGHNFAVGIELEVSKFEEFKEKINEIARRSLSYEELLPYKEVESILQFSEITERLAGEVSLFAPHGIDNPEPLFLSENVEIKQRHPSPNGRYEILFLRQAGRELKCLSPVKLLNGIPDRVSVIFALGFDKQSNLPILILKGWVSPEGSIVSEEGEPYLAQLPLWELWEEEYYYD
ncbi:MAG: single-stranded-DNA-specific exonuclease RecJ [bacterium]